MLEHVYENFLVANFDGSPHLDIGLNRYKAEWNLHWGRNQYALFWLLLQVFQQLCGLQ